MHQDPHTLDRKMVIEVENKTAGKSKAIGMPIKFSDTNSENNKGAPIFGQHTDTVLKDFGYTQDKLKNLNQKVLLHNF